MIERLEIEVVEGCKYRFEFRHAIVNYDVIDWWHPTLKRWIPVEDMLMRDCFWHRFGPKIHGVYLKSLKGRKE